MHRAGQLSAAEALYRKIIEAHPGCAEAHSNLGAAIRMQVKIDARRDALARRLEAVACYERAIALKPDLAETHNNLANVLKVLGRHEDALAACGRALALRPQYGEAHNTRGTVLRDLGRLHEAIASFREAVALLPDYAKALNNLGHALRLAGRLSEAQTCCERAVGLRPDYAAGYNTLGSVFRAQGRPAEAAACYRRALAIAPTFAKAHSNLIATRLFQPATTAADLLAEARAFARTHAAAVAALAAPHANDRTPDRRLRVGYFSPNFQRQPGADFLEAVFESHDRAQVEIFAYTEAHVASPATARLRALAAAWRVTGDLPDPAVVDRIRADAIDILVDLAGHAGGNRLRVFAARPAPVQVAWLGRPVTTGLAEMDYRLTDEIADPPGVSEGDHAERLIRLPGGFHCVRPPPAAPPPRPSPAARSFIVTFGALGDLPSLNEQILALWATILARVPQARLVVACTGFGEEATRRRIQGAVAGHGLGTDRVALLDPMAPEAHGFEHYSRIDVALDPFPVSDVGSICKALWMGTPVVTLAGDRHAARRGASVLAQAGLADLVAASGEEYVGRAVELARDPERRARLRTKLRDKVRASALCDGPGFVRILEDAYRRIWRRWCDQSSAWPKADAVHAAEG